VVRLAGAASNSSGEPLLQVHEQNQGRMQGCGCQIMRCVVVVLTAPVAVAPSPALQGEGRVGSEEPVGHALADIVKSHEPGGDCTSPGSSALR
jgi:hypothetical protein